MNLELIRRIDRLLTEKDLVLVAIDGNCASGKTTLANKLAERYDCNVLQLDDFFLRPEQRTAERFAQAGGNVDYERFALEVLEPLRRGEAFSYRPFDCHTMTLREAVTVTPKQLNIIEGSYSLHPYFGDAYDLRVLLTVAPEVQKERILQRPAFLHERFFQSWIPMEHHYLEALSIPQTVDLIL